MMLDNLRYDDVVLSFEGSLVNKVVLYVFFIAYCFMMPIIFLNLLVCVLFFALFFGGFIDQSDSSKL